MEDYQIAGAETIQALAKDILKTAHVVENNKYWSRHVSEYGPWSVPAAARSTLIKSGILQKMIVKRGDPLARKLPIVFFHQEDPPLWKPYASPRQNAAHIYLVRDEKKLQELSESEEPIAALLGIRLSNQGMPALNYKCAVEYLREEVARHPDPGPFVLQIMRDLLPPKRPSKR